MTKEEAISIIEEHVRLAEYVDNNYVDCVDIEALRIAIKALAQSERKKGKWIKMSDADGTYWCCSECGKELYRSWLSYRNYDFFPEKVSIDKTNFCPSCGADMRERKEE